MTSDHPVVDEVDGDVAELLPTGLGRELHVGLRHGQTATIAAFDLAVAVDDLDDRVGVEGEQIEHVVDRQRLPIGVARRALVAPAAVALWLRRRHRADALVDLLGTGAEEAVDLVTEGVVSRDIGAHRRDADTDGDDDTEEQRQAEAETHRSASTQDIPHPANGVEQAVLALGLGLAPQVPDVDVE